MIGVGSKASPTRPWVDAFAEEMEAKLAENRHKGDRDGWRREQVSTLTKRLLCEVGELVDAIGKKDISGTGRFRKAQIRSECADIANFAMMIADVAGGMRPKL